MTVHAIAKVLAWWIFWHPAAQVVEGPDPSRIVNRPCLHVGVRPHADQGEGAVTVQVTVCDPF